MKSIVLGSGAKATLSIVRLRIAGSGQPISDRVDVWGSLADRLFAVEDRDFAHIRPWDGRIRIRTWRNSYLIDSGK